MKRKIQFLLFTVLIAVIILIAIFVENNRSNDNILPENNNIETEDNAILEENNTIEVEDNGLLEEYTDGTITFDAIAANIVLPSGSTSDDLQTAVNNATSGDTIIISSNMQFLGEVTIPTGKTITIQSDSGNNWTMNQTTASKHFLINGELILQNIIIDGNNVGGGIYVYGSPSLKDTAIFNMYDGTIIQNNNKAGVQMYASSVFNMYGGRITKNTNDSLGGGVTFGTNGIFNMYAGTIDGNTASRGGGIDSYGIFNMYSGTISGNTAKDYGGAIRNVGGKVTINSTNGSCYITDNKANSGGAIYTSEVFGSIRYSKYYRTKLFFK